DYQKNFEISIKKRPKNHQKNQNVAENTVCMVPPARIRAPFGRLDPRQRAQWAKTVAIVAAPSRTARAAHSSAPQTLVHGSSGFLASHVVTIASGSVTATPATSPGRSPRREGRPSETRRPDPRGPCP